MPLYCHADSVVFRQPEVNAWMSSDIKSFYPGPYRIKLTWTDVITIIADSRLSVPSRTADLNTYRQVSTMTAPFASSGTVYRQSHQMVIWELCIGTTVLKESYAHKSQNQRWSNSLPGSTVDLWVQRSSFSWTSRQRIMGNWQNSIFGDSASCCCRLSCHSQKHRGRQMPYRYNFLYDNLFRIYSFWGNRRPCRYFLKYVLSILTSKWLEFGCVPRIDGIPLDCIFIGSSMYGSLDMNRSILFQLFSTSTCDISQLL